MSAEQPADGRRRAHPRPARRSLFAADSLTRHLHSDPLLSLAALRSLLLQALHPVSMQALAEHTSFARDPWSQLLGVLRQLRTVSHGSTEDALTSGARSRAILSLVQGTTPEGVDYRADDPQLLAWAHCCQVASILEITTRGGLHLTSSEQDRYVAEQVRAATLLGLEPDDVPNDRARLREYFQLMRPLLEATAAARSAAAVVIAQGSRHGMTGLAFAALPPWARRLYALPDLPGVAGLPDAATTLGLRAIRARLTPSVRLLRPPVRAVTLGPA